MNVKYAHTNIIASNWQALAKFYEQIFGCLPVPPLRTQSAKWLAQGTGVPDASLEGIHLRLPGYGNNGPTLEIYQYKQMEEKPISAANRQGLGHLAFLVDDVAKVRKEILQHGGSELGKVTEADVAGVGRLTFIYMTDPEGNILEIQNWS